MDIKEFVKETPRQIVEGVREVRHELETKAQIAPAESEPKEVKFDIAVTVDVQKNKAGKVGLSVYCFKADAGGQSSESTSTIHRVDFSVDVDFEPYQEPAELDLK
ncbi:MAG: trypco2 family protein [Planctomycetota bacterium]